MEKEKYDDYIARILSSRENNKDIENYQEKHHIKPKCLGGTDSKDNLIYLYGQEHYYAHKLLAEEFPTSQELNWAWWNMCHCNIDKRDIKISPDEYEDSRQRFAKTISEAFSGSNCYWYGKKQSEESNIKRSNKLLGEKNHMYGKTHSQSTIDKIKANRKGVCTGFEHFRSRAVRCLETGLEFATATEAAAYYKLKSRSSITQCCKGAKESAGRHPETKEKLHWCYVE